MLKNNALRLGVVAAVAAACLTLSAMPAYADPATPTTYGTLSGVGSDTTQDVMNAVTTAINATNSGLLASYDAVNPTTQLGGDLIQTKAANPAFTRPNGSGAGQIAVSKANGAGDHLIGGVDVTGSVQWSRSSVGPSSTLPGSDLTFIPFASDGMAYAVSAGSGLPLTMIKGVKNATGAAGTRLTLENIYMCRVTSYIDGVSGATVPIIPFVPQSGSGSRAAWLAYLGLSEAEVSASSCITNTSAVPNATNTGFLAVQENDGTYLTRAGEIMPFSIAQYYSQGKHKALSPSLVERRGNILLGSIGGIAPLVFTGGALAPNPDYPASRLVYNVVPTNKISGAGANAQLVSTFVGSTSLVCQQTATIAAYGFLPYGSCGDTSLTQAYKLS